MEYYDRRHLGTTPLSIGGAIPLESPVENGILPTYLARLISSSTRNRERQTVQQIQASLVKSPGSRVLFIPCRTSPALMSPVSPGN